MSLHNLIANGGKVLVVGGYDKSFREYRDHPQLVFWTGDDVVNKYARTDLPPNTKGVIVSRFTPHTLLHKVMKQARDKRATIFAPLADGEVKKKLDEIITIPKGLEKKMIPTTIEPEEKTEPKVMKPASENKLRKPAKGEIAAFVRRVHRPDTDSAGETTRILELMRSEGIEANRQTVYQAIWGLRKKPVQKSAQKSVQKEKKPDSSPLLKLIDDAMAAMQLVRDEIERVGTNIDELNELKAKLKALVQG